MSETAAAATESKRSSRKIELSIQSNYLPHWGLWEGVREFVQNARDAQIEFGDKFAVWHDPKSNRLFIENDGTPIPLVALLIGHTSKADRGDLAGQFGEGLDAGLLVLTRAGHEVVVRNGGEVWRPCLEPSAGFKADVLKIEVATGRKAEGRVRVEIGGIDAETWAAMKPRFRFLTEAEETVLAVDDGHILMDAAMAGHLFVKGIYVGHEEGLGVGYDFHGSDVKVDRDRKMVASWDLRWRTGRMWRQASHLQGAKTRVAIDKLTQLAFDGANDLSTVAESAYCVNDFSDEAKAAILGRFQAENGNAAHPVDSIQESMELEHSGKVGVRASKAVRAFVEGKLGKLDEVKKALKKSVVREFGTHELTEDEKAAFTRALGMLQAADASLVDGVPIDVVEFRDASLRGLWQPDGGRICIARKEMASWDATLLVLLHEACHKVGTDGSASHDLLIQETWRKVAVNLAAKGGA